MHLVLYELDVMCTVTRMKITKATTHLRCTTRNQFQGLPSSRKVNRPI